jgi:hypothetical protein
MESSWAGVARFDSGQLGSKKIAFRNDSESIATKPWADCRFCASGKEVLR